MWFDNKSVHLLSSHKGINPPSVVQRWSVADKRFIEIQRPDIEKHYNIFLGGVDIACWFRFRSEIPNGLLKANKENLRKRGRRSSLASSPVVVTPSERAKALPVNDVRYDRLGHFPTHIEPKQRC
ncbi:hypothetical protein HHI36_014095, partial [Cryptolaemus montrouzieri]